MEPLAVAVLCGGQSTEAEVSRNSGRQVSAALESRGHKTQLIEADGNMWGALQETAFDVCFVAMHGRFGEDGTVQGVLELLGIPYTGSDVLGCALAMNKVAAKTMFVANGIDTPPYVVVAQESPDPMGEMAAAASTLKFPMVVKPNRSGSTIGLTIVSEDSGLSAAYNLAAEHDQVICEKFIGGTEITVGILGHPPRPLPTLEIVSHRPLYDYEAKYTEGLSQHIIPARISDTNRVAAQRAALQAFNLLSCRDFGRVDVIVDSSGTPWILEVNAIPGMTALSLLPDAAKAAGVGFEDLCEKLCGFALARREKVKA